jgi:hypothetical protein
MGVAACLGCNFKLMRLIPGLNDRSDSDPTEVSSTPTHWMAVDPDYLDHKHQLCVKRKERSGTYKSVVEQFEIVLG